MQLKKSKFKTFMPGRVENFPPFDFKVVAHVHTQITSAFA